MKLYLSALFFLFTLCAAGQSEMDQPLKKKPKTPELHEKEIAVTAGFLYGGGSLLGVDVEKVLYKKFAAQVGFGFLGFGAGINYHPKSFSTSFFSLQYIHQGVGSTYVHSLIGPTYNLRWKFIAAQLGYVFVVDKGPLYNVAFPNGAPSVVLMYSLGVFKLF